MNSNQELPTTDSAYPPTSQVIGKIADTNGKPIAQAGVAVTKSSTGVPEILVLTDKKGGYTWELPPGEFTLAAYKDGYAKKSKDITVKAGQIVELDFQLEKQL